MTGSRWLIMAMLAVLTAVFCVQTARTWQRPVQARLAAEADTGTAAAQGAPLPRQRKPPKSAYEVIAARSLFDPERTGGTGVAASNLKRTETSRYAKRIDLFGVVIDGGEKMALIDTGARRRGGNDLVWVRVGDAIERIKVVGIQRDRIILEENGSHYEILLSDQRHPDRRARPEEDTGPTVITTESEGDKAPDQSAKAPKIRVKPQPKTDAAKD